MRRPASLPSPPCGTFLPVLAGLAGALVALGSGCAPPEPAVPAAPSYAVDVRPLFVAHCVRCHGAGGTLNQALNPNGGADAGPLPSVGGRPAEAYLGQYDDSGDCTTQTPACHRGAHYMATQPSNLLHLYLHPPAGFPSMPPPPSPRLDDWELKVVDAWLLNPLP